METETKTTSDERLMAGLAHFFGALVALLIWLMQKDKSRFIRFQAVQAMAFDLVVMLFSLVVSVFVVGVAIIAIIVMIFGGLLVAANVPSPEDISWLFFIPGLLPFTAFACVLPYSFGILIARSVAAISTFGGRDFRYPWLGEQVEKFLGE